MQIEFLSKEKEMLMKQMQTLVEQFEQEKKQYLKGMPALSLK